MNSDAATAAAKSAGIVKYSVTSESESELADDLEVATVALQLGRGMWKRKRGRCAWSERACWYPSFQFL